MSSPDRSRVLPSEFIEWADRDSRTGDRRAQGNAITNIKRAIHCRIDEYIGNTHVEFASDWNPRDVPTARKLDILRRIGVQEEVIVSVITEARNDFEHEYKLRPLRDVQMALAAAKLWIEKSYREHTFPKIAFGDIPLEGIGTTSPSASGSRVGFLKFGQPRKSTYFDRVNKAVVFLMPDGTEEHRRFCDLKFDEILRIEAPFIRRAMRGECGCSLNDASLADVLQRYRTWVRSQAPSS